PAFDDADVGTESGSHDRRDQTTHAAAVAQRQDGAGARAERTPGARAEASQLPAAPDQRRGDAAAKPDGHVAVILDRDEHETRAALPVHTKSAECESAHDAPGYEHVDAGLRGAPAR